MLKATATVLSNLLGRNPEHCLASWYKSKGGKSQVGNPKYSSWFNLDSTSGFSVQSGYFIVVILPQKWIFFSRFCVA